MNRVSLVIIAMLLALGTIVGCSILKENDTEGKVKNFLARFEADLRQSDSLATLHFRTDQPEWALRSALKLMNNQEGTLVSVNLMFPQAVVAINDSITVNIPLTMTADSAGITSQRLTNIELTLRQADTTFVITRWNGAGLYEIYWSFIAKIKEGENASQIRESRGHFYTRARELQETYDSVIWFANTEPMHYYYVVKGDWKYPYNESLATDRYRMGLSDETGKLVIPMEFDLIGMPGELGEDLIEVKNNDKYGCYQLSTGQQIMPADYTWIIPYETGTMLVKNDTTIGWYDAQYAFHAGYPSKEAEVYVKNFKFLPEQIRLSNEDAQYLEIPNELHASVGYTIPASYLTYFGILSEIEGEYTGEIFNEEAGVEYKEAKLSFFEEITHTFSALIIDARDAYVFSREGFYDHSSITFMNSKGEMTDKTDLEASGDLAFKMIDSTLLEIKITFSEENISENYEQEIGSGVESNTPRYYYFSLGENMSLTRLKSNRWYLCSEFVKLDSTYITGNFMFYNESGLAYESTLSSSTLNEMRNEILAEYGYSFPDSDTAESFKYKKWYSARYASISDFESELSEIDRHNLQFLEKILGPVGSVASM